MTSMPNKHRHDGSGLLPDPGSSPIQPSRPYPSGTTTAPSTWLTDRRDAEWLQGCGLVGDACLNADATPRDCVTSKPQYVRGGLGTTCTGLECPAVQIKDVPGATLLAADTRLTRAAGSDCTIELLDWQRAPIRRLLQSLQREERSAVNVDSVGA
jgi:hypothetical protein